MLVCHCKSISERDIREAVQAGARTRAAVGRACGAGRECGGCSSAVDEILREERGQQQQIELLPASPLATAAG